MSENTKVLNDADMEQVSGGEEGGGGSGSWSELVCPKCHGHVEAFKMQLGLSPARVTRYRCRACNETFSKSSLVEE